ncbi:MAG: hypothetical protein DMF59_05555 [Acidobacteria bacterium]|nr:MAG: hypothetical protein DMF59_05555 [Acidobacteriota bacterium]
MEGLTMAQRFEGKNLEEALNSAAETFGVQRFQLTYHVLLEKRGFLGGMKRVVIEAEVNTEAPQIAEERVAPASGDRPRRERSRGGRHRDRGEQRGNERRDRHRRSPERREEQDFAPIEIPEQGPESRSRS